MDYQQIVDELRAEKVRVEKALDILNQPARKPAASAARGSWTRTDEAKEAQSQRMKAYWAKWRKAHKRTAA